MVGKQLGKFRIEEEIGRGGMGVVYRAIDSRLGRSVAIKVLPAAWAHSAEHRSRFEREARLLASLNHPNIAAIHGVEDFDGTCGLVLEYVAGETLAERIASRPMPVNECLTIACRIAEALETAHRQGIIHRDLKPANVKITADDAVKVLDFGLAKVFEPARAAAAAGVEAGATETMTAAHAIVGTPAYMSPEQAQGKPVDQRTDVWSFGCVLYELLTRWRAFGGDTVSDQLASVLAKEPEWKALPRDLDARVSKLLRRCLEKDLHRRLRDAGDARLELEDALSGAVVEGVAPTKRRPLWAALAAGLVLGAATVGSWTWAQLRRAPAPPVVRLAFDLPEGQRITPTWNSTIAFSPDGTAVAFSSVGGNAVGTFVRRLDELDAKPIASRMGVPVFSPDGRYLIMQRGNVPELKRAPLSGGPPVTFTSFDHYVGGDWAPDNYYYWTNGYFGPIIRTPAFGGKNEAVTRLNSEKQERTHRHPKMLPGGKAILFTVAAGGMDTFDDARIDAYTLESKARRTLVDGGFSPKYSPSGHIVYARGGSLYAVPFDSRSLKVGGSPVKVLDGVAMNANTGAADFDLSASGSLAYVGGKIEGLERTLVWVDREGKATPLPLPARPYLFPRISPDGRQVAFEVEGVNHDLYAYDPAREVTSKISTDGVSHAPVWTPDGKRIAFRSWKAGTMTMWWMPSDRSAPEERLTTIGERQSAVSFSPDGRFMTYNQMDGGGAGSVWILPLTGDRTPAPFVKSKFMGGSGRFSPDGKWVAYCSNESGRSEIYVQPWPGPGPKIQVSSEGGTDPIWSHDGKELFYRDGKKMMVVPITLAGGLQAGKPRALWEGDYSQGMGASCGTSGPTAANYDVSSDGRRFLMIKNLDEVKAPARIVVIVNFAEELKRLSKTN